MALPKNRQAVQELLKELEPRIIGKEREGFSCNCGAVHCDTAVADEIRPAGDSYPGQETCWAIWSVHMKAHGQGSSWSCGLSAFIEADELDAMFSRYFGDQDEGECAYKLAVDGETRVRAALPVAVRIQENDSQMRFSFSWGREQRAAERLEALQSIVRRRLPAGSEAYLRVVSILEAIRPEIYRGGPDPELPHESTWHLDYDASLRRAAATAHHVFFQNGESFSDHQGTVYTRVDVVFMKHEVK